MGLVVRLREWPEEGPKQCTMMISICNHQFRVNKKAKESVKKVKQEMKRMNDERKYRVNNPHGPTLAATMESIEDAKKAKKAAKEAEKLKRRQEKEARKQERARLKRERKEFAASHSKEFAEMNNIHNYFASSLKNMPSGTRNAFDVLGKKKVDKD